MAKKLKVWLNNKLNKCLRCTVVIKFYRIFITELVLNFFNIKNSGNSGGEGGGHQRPPGMENPGRWGGGANQRVFCGGGMDIFWNHTIEVVKIVQFC